MNEQQIAQESVRLQRQRSAVKPTMYYNDDVNHQLGHTYILILPLEVSDYHGLFTRFKKDDHYEIPRTVSKYTMRALPGSSLTKEQVIYAIQFADRMVRNDDYREALRDMDDYETEPPLAYSREQINGMVDVLMMLFIAADLNDMHQEEKLRNQRKPGELGIDEKLLKDIPLTDEEEGYLDHEVYHYGYSHPDREEIEALILLGDSK